jgi:hypothetical protein
VPAPLGRLLLLLALAAPARGETRPYPWLPAGETRAPLSERILPPAGFRRVEAPAGTFGAWLRGLPLKEGRPPVRLHDGRLKRNQEAHWGVLDIDTGRGDLQQCADAVMRLRAEYLFASEQARSVAFNFTSGDRAAFDRWADGYRPRVRGNDVSWRKSARAAAT